MDYLPKMYLARRKPIDENRLVEMLGQYRRHQEIADQLGVSRTLVSNVAAGICRPELKERIDALRRQYGPLKTAAQARRIKEYDEDLLVDLIGRGEYQFKEIAQRVSISPAMVGLIANGHCRKDLQGRINAARAHYLKEARAQGLLALRDFGPPSSMAVSAMSGTGVSPVQLGGGDGEQGRDAHATTGARATDGDPSTGSGPSEDAAEAAPYVGKYLSDDPRVAPAQSPSRQRSCVYDDDLMVELLATAGMSHEQIAQKLGCDRQTVWGVATGRRRLDLQPRIREAMAAHRVEAHRLATRYLTGMLGTHIKTGVQGQGDLARKCREYVMNRGWQDEPAAAAAGKADSPLRPCKECVHRSFIQDVLSLPEELLKQVIAGVGGPTGNDHMYVQGPQAAEPT